MPQLELFASEPLTPVVCASSTPEKADPQFYTGLPERAGMATYVHIIRGDDDPERGPRNGQTLRWRRIADHPPAAWLDRIVQHLSDGVPRTFNRIMVELADFTADVAAGTHADKGLWLGVAQKRLALTLEAPILFTAIDDEAVQP
ncbi:MAG TPA: hypothetical protein VFX59_22215 [Polyangiales bacterium]|nr:hypothetical protein [Polyangiales bacterium]